MYTTQHRPAAPPLERLAAWLGSPDLVRALALSTLVGAAMTASFVLGRLPPQAAAAEAPRVAAQSVRPAPATPATWTADDSASGTRPDCAH